MSDPALAGRVALVTGAGQGTGRGIALALAAAGARVALVGRRAAPLHAVADEVAARGSSALVLPADVTRREQIDGAVATLDGAWGRLDVVVTAAYDSRVGRLDDLTAADAAADWASGFEGTLFTMQATHALLARQGGAVITIGAATGLKPDTTTFALYASTKEAIRSLTRTAACEWAGHGIRVNTLIPLATSPSFTRWGEEHCEDFQIILDSIPLRWLGDAEHDVGPVAVFLAGDDSRYLTGTTLLADGGRGYLR